MIFMEIFFMCKKSSQRKATKQLRSDLGHLGHTIKAHWYR